MEMTDITNNVFETPYDKYASRYRNMISQYDLPEVNLKHLDEFLLHKEHTDESKLDVIINELDYCHNKILFSYPIEDRGYLAMDIFIKLIFKNLLVRLFETICEVIYNNQCEAVFEINRKQLISLIFSDNFNEQMLINDNSNEVKMFNSIIISNRIELCKLFIISDRMNNEIAMENIKLITLFIALHFNITEINDLNKRLGIVFRSLFKGKNNNDLSATDYVIINLYGQNFDQFRKYYPKFILKSGCKKPNLNQLLAIYCPDDIDKIDWLCEYFSFEDRDIEILLEQLCYNHFPIVNYLIVRFKLFISYSFNIDHFVYLIASNSHHRKNLLEIINIFGVVNWDYRRKLSLESKLIRDYTQLYYLRSLIYR